MSDSIKFENSEFKFSAIDEQAFSDWGKGFTFGSFAGDTITLGETDMVNSPAHYTRGSQEAIDIIEDAIMEAPSTKHGFLQGQVLKYLLRL